MYGNGRVYCCTDYISLPGYMYYFKGSASVPELNKGNVKQPGRIRYPNDHVNALIRPGLLTLIKNE